MSAFFLNESMLIKACILSAQTVKRRLHIPIDQCYKKTNFVFAFRFGFFFLALKITKSQSLGSCSFVNIYSYLYHYNRRKGMSGLFKCQLTKRFFHSVLCCCVETLKKRPLSVIPRLSHGTTSTCTCENSLVIVWTQITLRGSHCQLCTKWESKGAAVLRVVIFYFFPLGSQTDMYVG